MSRTRPAPWKATDYARAARQLRAAGYSVSYRRSSRNPHHKAAVRRLWNQHGSRVAMYLRHGFRFVRSTKSHRRKFVPFIAREQWTPRGFFIQPPHGVPADEMSYRARGGVLEISGRNRRDVIVRLDPELLAVDPEEAVRRAIGPLKPTRISMLVNGFRSSVEYDPKLFYAYFARGIRGPSLIEELMDEGRHGGPLDASEIADVFSLRLIFARNRKKDAYTYKRETKSARKRASTKRSGDKRSSTKRSSDKRSGTERASTKRTSVKRSSTKRASVKRANTSRHARH